MNLGAKIAAARSREVSWDEARHVRVREGVERVYVARKRRARTVSVVLSSFAGAALFALAVRAFGSAEAPSGGAEARLPPAPMAYADGGYRSDATLRD